MICLLLKLERKKVLNENYEWSQNNLKILLATLHLIILSHSYPTLEARNCGSLVPSPPASSDHAVRNASVALFPGLPTVQFLITIKWQTLEQCNLFQYEVITLD